MVLQNSSVAQTLIKSFNQITFPQLPFKRELNEEEKKIMYTHFQNHSFSNIDKNGVIVLGGGEADCGRYYITEKDLVGLKNIYERP